MLKCLRPFFSSLFRGVSTSILEIIDLLVVGSVLFGCLDSTAWLIEGGLVGFLSVSAFLRLRCIFVPGWILQSFRTLRSW